MRGLPRGGRQFGHAVDGPLAQSGEHVVEMLAQMNVQASAGLDDRGDGRHLGAGLFAADMQPVFPAQHNRPQAGFAPIIIRRHPAIRQIDFQPAPLAQGIVAGFGQGAPGRDLLPDGHQAFLERGQARHALLLTQGQALRTVQARSARGFFKGVKFTKLRHDLRRPGIVVADMGDLSAPSKQAVRAGWQCAAVTKLRTDMKLVPPYVNAARVECPQGQRLEWWEYEPASGQQWFRVPVEPELCAHCREAASCPRHFGCAGGQHETLLGLLALASRVAQRLLRQVRPWIEPAQSFEKNLLGLGQRFFNSLRLTWQMSLWTDSAVLLRTMVWLDTPTESSLLSGLQARQLELELTAEK